jgi:hypothetical protein
MTNDWKQKFWFKIKPVGLAAGFDKDASCTRSCQILVLVLSK